jgi:hypothetical protein
LQAFLPVALGPEVAFSAFGETAIPAQKNKHKASTEKIRVFMIVK